MKKKELLQQLNNLKKTIKPDATWQKNNRDILLCQIKGQTQQANLKIAYIKMFNFSKFLYTMAKPVGSLLVILAVVLGSWVATVGATKNSMPGDFLYPVKITTERVKVNLTLNDEKRTNLEMAFAERRLDEIKKVTVANPDVKEKLNEPLKQFQASMVNVKSNLVKIEKTDKATALFLANLIDEKAKEYVTVLVTNQEKMPELSVNTAGAISASKNIGDKALDLIIEDAEQTPVEATTNEENTDLTQVKEKVTARIVDLANNLAAAETKLTQIMVNKKQAAAQAASLASKATPETTPAASTETIAPEATAQPAPADNPTESPVAEPVAEPSLSPEQAKGKIAEANGLLASAKELLSNDEVSQAFELVKQADEVWQIISTVIVANKEYLTQAPEPTAEPVVPAVGEGDVQGILNQE